MQLYTATTRWRQHHSTLSDAKMHSSSLDTPRSHPGTSLVLPLFLFTETWSDILHNVSFFYCCLYKLRDFVVVVVRLILFSEANNNLKLEKILNYIIFPPLSCFIFLDMTVP